jgi:hypothetical protein
MQSDQVKGMLDRAIAVLATWLLTQAVNKGWITQSDVAQLLPALILLPSLAWGWWINRNKALLQSAANVVGDDGKKTVIVASPELAQATPANENIVSNTEAKVITQ